MTGGRDRLAARLQQDAAEAQGRLHRNLARRISVPDQTVAAAPVPRRRLGAAGDSDSEGDSSSDDDSGSSSDDDEAAAARAASEAALASGIGTLPYGAGRFAPGHELTATALALSVDGATAFTVSKDGGILKWDVETMAATPLRRPGGDDAPAVEPEAADWVKRRAAGRLGARALYAAALSTDGRLLAVGGGDRRVHVFDALSGAHTASYPGHRDAITALAFREGSHTLYSAALDRTVKMWSLDDGAYGAPSPPPPHTHTFPPVSCFPRAPLAPRRPPLFFGQAACAPSQIQPSLISNSTHPALNNNTPPPTHTHTKHTNTTQHPPPAVDTLFGHQAEVYSLDSLRQERVVTCGHDHTCRVWKVAEESHLVFRAPHPSVGCCRYITATEWLSGDDNGSLQVWSQMKKKPVSVVKGAHMKPSARAAAAAAAAAANGGGGGGDAAAAAPAPPARGSWATANSEAAAWVQSVAVARGSDFAASGAGDGFIRLWAVEQSKHGGAGYLAPLGALPALGFVNGLAIERRGRFVAAAVGPETRLGRWGRVEGARSGLLVHRLDVAPEADD